jgi:hypothetical protein
MVVGMLAFGGKWDNLLGLDATGLYPIKVAEDHAVAAKKVRGGPEGRALAAQREAPCRQQLPVAPQPCKS